MKILSKDNFNKACESINTYGRPIEKALLQRYFFNGSIEDIITELKKFQNQDGGFGNGLESDFRLPYSSAMATSVGLRILCEIDENSESKEMIKAALKYLEQTFVGERNGWFAVSKEVNNFPHAPWWHYDDEDKMTAIDKNWSNPTAEILAYIFNYREYIKVLDADKLLEYAINYIENKVSSESEHELYCYLKLYEVLPEEIKTKLETKLKEAINQIVIYDESKWHEYVPTPIEFVNDLNSNRFGISENSINTNLDFIISQLETHGKINPPWGASFYSEGLAEAYNEWIGVLTLNALIKLDKCNRIAEV